MFCRRLSPLPGSRRRRSPLFLFPHRISQSIATTDFLPNHSISGEPEEICSTKPIFPTPQERAQKGGGGGEVSFSHPWPEWVELMEKLLRKGYMDDPDGFHKNSCLSSKDSNRIRTACLDFARDRFDLFKYLPKKDIQVIVESGCPSSDRKVVNSGKRLRAHLGIQEANVCGSCNLQGNCERAYVEPYEVEGGRTVDVMRILLTYGLDLLIGAEDSHFCLNSNIKESSRKLLSDMLTFSANELKSDCSQVGSRKVSSASQQSTGKQMPKSHSNATREGDWICPKCDFLNFKKNIRCLRCDEMSQEKLKKLWEEREHLPLKRGDWICNTCNFFNFAKNTKCLQCNEKPVQRHLGPGEWECPSCYFVNFRRNTVCLKCDWKRPKASVAKPTFADFQLDANQQSREHPSPRANQHCFVQPDDPLGSNDMGFWSSEDDNDNDNDNSDTFMKFEDFPMAGGKCGISQDPLGNQRWKDKKKFNERSKVDKQKSSGASSARHYSEGSRVGSANLRNSDLYEISDDDNDGEISGWFGLRVKKNNG